MRQNLGCVVAEELLLQDFVNGEREKFGPRTVYNKSECVQGATEGGKYFAAFDTNFV